MIENPSELDISPPFISN